MKKPMPSSTGRPIALASQLELHRDFTIDWTVRTVDLTQRGQSRLDELVAGSGDQEGFWHGRRRREELVTQAVTGAALLRRAMSNT